MQASNIPTMPHFLLNWIEDEWKDRMGVEEVDLDKEGDENRLKMFDFEEDGEKLVVEGLD